ncbi:uncharacterized protein HKW66_Vig0002680 [Vigna angularis]|uniref:Uncharacterized protein n=1 Tax=Phaseolus angularis TaxID=3914 RepID=A0A8T0LH02_PHAAN|nr:uncharacterized protein HKW66_Vig0002680 [Vigna angularis]
MVDELDDLEQCGLFNRREIAKIDFLAYIEYETQLDALYELRKMSVAREFRNQGNKKLKKSKIRENGRMKTALTKVIRFHRKVSGVWIYAAAWEFDRNFNVVAARALMKEGLRVCPTSKDFWVEYLRVELTYLIIS